MTRRTAKWIAIAALCAGAASLSSPADAQGILILKAKKKAALAQAQTPVVVAPPAAVTVVPVQRVAPPVARVARPGPPVPLLLRKALN